MKIPQILFSHANFILKPNFINHLIATFFPFWLLNNKYDISDMKIKHRKYSVLNNNTRYAEIVEEIWRPH